MVQLKDITSFTDFAIVMLFFISLVLFINYFSRLAGKVFKIF